MALSICGSLQIFSQQYCKLWLCWPGLAWPSLPVVAWVVVGRQAGQCNGELVSDSVISTLHQQQVAV
jgi:hypothetical protein